MFPFSDQAVNSIAKIAIEKFERSGRLCGAICRTMCLLSAYEGEDNEFISEFGELLMKNLSAIKLEAFSSGDDDDETGISNGPYNMIIALSALGFFSVGTLFAVITFF